MDLVETGFRFALRWRTVQPAMASKRSVLGLRRPLLRVLCALFVGAACGTGCSEPAPPAPRNLILISVDTLRPDRLGLHGFERPTTPTLDALAAEGVRFARVSSTAPWTLPAHATLLTGLYPSRHGVKTHERFLQDHVVTLAEAFQARGYQTAGIVNSHNLSPRYGLSAGFEHFDYVKEDVAQREPTDVEANACAWLAGLAKPAGGVEHPPAIARDLTDVPRRPDEPFFLFLHYYDVHSDYASQPEYESEFVPAFDGLADGTTAQCMEVRGGRLTFEAADGEHLDRLYQAGIRQWDDGLARLLAKLDELGVLGRRVLGLPGVPGEVVERVGAAGAVQHVLEPPIADRTGDVVARLVVVVGLAEQEALLELRAASTPPQLADVEAVQAGR